MYAGVEAIFRNGAVESSRRNVLPLLSPMNIEPLPVAVSN